MDYIATILQPTISIVIEFDSKKADAEVVRVAMDEFRKTKHNTGAVVDVDEIGWNYYKVTFEYGGEAL